MALLSAKSLSLSFGGLPLFLGLDLQIEAGERICLVGRNGEGKSSLIRVLAGQLEPDAGEIVRQKGLRTASLAQEAPAHLSGSVYEVTADGLAGMSALLSLYHEAGRRLEHDHSPAAIAGLEKAQQALEAAGGFAASQRVDAILTRLGLPADQPFASLSGGIKRRALLARALVNEPELLFLDEPTNHLDIEAIARLEEFLLSFNGAALFITHDRALLARVATRIIELDRGRLTSWPGDYQTYLRRREEALAAEEGQNRRFDKKLAQEEAWIRQGIKARRTRNEGRVRALETMRRERAARRSKSGPARMTIPEAAASGRLVAELKDVSFAYGEDPIVKNLSVTIMRGDRIGIIGPNGAGKTTLIKLITGQLAPAAGSIRTGTGVAPCWFDQNREQLDPEKTVAEIVGDGHDRVIAGGQSRHILGYLQDFLFAPERSRSPVAILSGGEKNRLLLARLFLTPFNLLIMDEPTNDLDVETLELLEELLLDYQGTLILVSHDRAFLNNVVTSTLVFEGQGRVGEYAGGYDDWLIQRPEPEKIVPAVVAGKPEKAKTRENTKARKLSYKEERELAALPQRLEELEAEQEALHRQLADPELYRKEAEAVAGLKTRLMELEAELEAAFARWEELEAIKEGGG